jgi:hypothetical protein
MLDRMVETWLLWLFVVGLATGVVVTLVVVVRLPRDEDDVSAAERPTEAAWIGAIIERNGGVAPVLLVEEVLELHQAYLRETRPPVPSANGLGLAELPGAAAYGPMGPPQYDGPSGPPQAYGPYGQSGPPTYRPVAPPPTGAGVVSGGGPPPMPPTPR